MGLLLPHWELMVLYSMLVHFGQPCVLVRAGVNYSAIFCVFSKHKVMVATVAHGINPEDM